MSTYTFNANGARTSAVFGNGTRTDYTRNLAGLATRVEHRHGDTVLSRFDNSYHLDGNIQQVIETMSGETRTITYTYDSARRLIREQDAGFRTLDRQYEFDNRGNRTRMTVTGDETYEVTYTYDLSNRLLTETRTGDNPSTNTFTYDRNGNQLTRVTMGVTETHTYNAFNQLVQVTNPSTTVTYTYRADGLRRSKTINGTPITHVWMGSHVVLERRGDSGAVVNRFHRSVSGRLVRSEHHGWYLHNVRGDVVQRVDDAGVVLRNYRYTAFGVELDQQEGNTNAFRFAGEYWDWATETYYLRARHFSPRTGRFSQEDPFWGIHNLMDCQWSIMQAGNLYMFAVHNPAMWIDPTGLRIQLVGTDEEKYLMYRYMQQLTNHSLHVGDDGFVTISREADRELIEMRGGIWLEQGNALIERIIASNLLVTVELFSGDRSFFWGDDSTMFHNVGRGGSGGRIFLNSNNHYYTYVFDAYGIAVLERAPTFMVLGHELIHADRAMRGVSIRSSVTTEIQVPVYRAPLNPMRVISDVRYATHRRIPHEELATIGIGNRHRSECITENMLRAEHGLRPRASWRGA